MPPRWSVPQARSPARLRRCWADLPLYNVMQQKIAFPDTTGAIPRNLPFAIDLDSQMIDWSNEERGLLGAAPASAHLAAEMLGAIHCRPDGGDHGRWIKLGWANNAKRAKASGQVPTDPRFPEVVPRGAARLHPALKAYYGPLPQQTHHYGSWDTRTADGWPWGVHGLRAVAPRHRGGLGCGPDAKPKLCPPVHSGPLCRPAACRAARRRSVAARSGV